MQVATELARRVNAIAYTDLPPQVVAMWAAKGDKPACYSREVTRPQLKE